jgi:hypothetical protein
LLLRTLFDSEKVSIAEFRKNVLAVIEPILGSTPFINCTALKCVRVLRGLAASAACSFKTAAVQPAVFNFIATTSSTQN